MPDTWLSRPLLATALPLCLMGCTDFDVVDAPEVTYTAISTADVHACGLTTDGDVYCWSGSDPRPTHVSGSVRFSSISTFVNHSCGVGLDDRVYCWGFNIVGELGTGELGADVNADRCVIRSFTGAQTVTCSRTPLLVRGDLLFQSVSVGSRHSCGLTTDGEAYCWGSNSNGQLGTVSDIECETDFGVLPCGLEPAPVEGGLWFASITTGRNHTCAVTLDGAAYCWGAGGSGRLGHGSVEDSPVPAPVSGGLTFRSVSAGGSHSCGVTTDDTLYCWGANADLQLGEVVTEPACGSQFDRCVTTPNRLPGDLRFTSVTASNGPSTASGTGNGGHTCGLTTDDRVYCWGLNENGQLLGSNQPRTSTPVAIAAAGLYNTCGVYTNGTVICWAFGSPWSSWIVPAG